MRDDFRIGAESSRWIRKLPMDQKAPDGSESSRWIRIQTVALFYPKCANSQNMKSQRSISNELQYKAKHDFILISKKICNDIFVI